MKRILFIIPAFLLLGVECSQSVRPESAVNTAVTNTQTDTQIEASSTMPASLRTVSYDGGFPLQEGETVALAKDFFVTLQSVGHADCSQTSACAKTGEGTAKLEITVQNGGEQDVTDLHEKTAANSTVFLHQWQLIKIEGKTATIRAVGVPVLETQQVEE